MTRIDQLNEYLSHLQSVKGLSVPFDQQIAYAERIHHRAVMSVRHGEPEGFLVDKFFRTDYWLRFHYGQKQTKCVACNGSGHYDSFGSPDCGACDGLGKENTPGEHAFQSLRDQVKMTAPVSRTD